MTSRRLIVLVGMDGAGKTRQARRLVDALRCAGVPARYLWCRGRNVLSLPLIVMGRRLHGAPQSHQHLFTDSDRRRESRYQRNKKHLLRNPVVRWVWSGAVLSERLVELAIRTRLAHLQAPTIVADRYLYDSLVDLAVDLGDSPALAAQRLRRWYTRLLPRPSRVFLLDLDPDTAFSRKPDIPSRGYLARRRDLYRTFACAAGWHIVDAVQPPEQVFQQLWRRLAPDLLPSGEVPCA